ncbi:putative SNARE associated golgi family protein [Helianthus anomalus]
MAAPRSLVMDTGRLMKDEETAAVEDSPTSKKPAGAKLDGRYPLTGWEFTVALSVFLVFTVGLFCIYLTMPAAAEYGKLKLPRSISDLRLLKDDLGTYASIYPTKFILGYCSTYIFMQTFMIPGTIFMSLLAGALFGVKGIFLVVFNATAGASCCFFLSKLIGRPIVLWLWPEKLKLFQAEIAKRGDKLLNYMLFLRITPTLPNLFINLASPIVDIPFHVFFLATVVGLIPASYITVRAGLALGELNSIKDLYDLKTLTVLFLIGSISILPTVLKRKRVYE